MSKMPKLVLLALATLVVGLAAISDQSFWIDEGAAAVKAMQPTLGGWWAALVAEGNSNLQLLPHLVYLWGWEKLFGASEIALRWANVPLLFLGLMASCWGLEKHRRLRAWFCACALTNAFTWYYLSEARPYILLFATSSLALGGLVRLIDERDSAINPSLSFAGFCSGLFLVSAASTIAIPWALCWGVCALILVGPQHFLGLVRRNYKITLVFCAAMLLLAIYDVWTIHRGARASGIGTTGVANILFVLYEQLGLIGFGAGRAELRDFGLRALVPFTIPLAIGFSACGILLWQAGREIAVKWDFNRVMHFATIGIVLPAGLVLFAGHSGHVRLLARHLMPLFPIILLALTLGLQRLWGKRGALGKLTCCLIGTVFLISSLQVRFASRHFRDDYRGAALIAREALNRGWRVWWLADESTGIYYRLPLAHADGKSLISTPPPGDLGQNTPPDVIILSKPDLYDSTHEYQRYAAEHRFVETRRLRAFAILERPDVAP